MRSAPLAGRRIAITRAGAQAEELAAKLRALGAEPLICPTIAYAPPLDMGPLDAALSRLSSYHWLIVTSAQAVRALFERMGALGLEAGALAGLRIGAVGPATARELGRHGASVGFTPREYAAAGMLAEIGEVAGQRFLLPAADIARDTLADGLRAHGAIVDIVVAYRTVPGPGGPRLAALLRSGALDAITFTSSSTVRYLLAALEQAGLAHAEARSRLSATAVVCIGPATAGFARQEGLRVAAEAREATADSMIEALVQLYASAR
jgi:uroporphyrinogen-III synthase